MCFPDMYIIAAMKRSLCLLRGFADLVESRNYVAAAPLVRLQMDNALRVAALARVKAMLRDAFLQASKSATCVIERVSG
jgi:hypothetical protein